VGGFCALNASNGQFLWSFSTPSLDAYSSPALFKGVVYTGGNTNIYALNSATGSKIWSFQTNATVFAPAIDNSLVFVSSMNTNWQMDSSVYALNALTGSLVWRFSVNHRFCSSPAIADGVVFVGCEDGSLYALNETSGMKLWSNGPKIWIQDGSGYIADGHVSPAAIANGKVYFGATNENSLRLSDIYALDHATGTKTWIYHMSGFINGAVVAAGNEIFLTGNDRYVYALNAETGDEVWKYMTASGIMSSPSVADGIVYVGSDDGSIYAIGGDTLSSGPNPTAKPRATPAPTPIPSATPTVSSSPSSDSSASPTPKPTPLTSFGFEMNGNISSTQVSDINWVTDQNTTKISFTVTGESGTFGFSNITIAKGRVPHATTPIIYVDNQIVPEQGYTQDAQNYYVWFIVHFSTHHLVIDFSSDATATPQVTDRVSGSVEQIDLRDIAFGLAIAFAIVAAVTVVLKLAVNEKKKPNR
jgi:outer membrane protein assembly factor BamB